MGRDKGRDLVVEVALPVHALGNRLDHQVAVLELRQVFFVVGWRDQIGFCRHTERRRLELFQVGNRLLGNRAFGAFLGRQVKQHHRHAHIDEVGRNLRPHHPGAEHRHFFHHKSGHGYSTFESRQRF